MSDYVERPTEWVMGLSRADMQNHPEYGIMGNMWRRANPTFVLPGMKSALGLNSVRANRPAAGTAKPTTPAAVQNIVTANNLRAPTVVAPGTGGVCLCDTGTGTLCGAVCGVSTAMNRHMFTKHPAQILPYRSGTPGPHPQEALALSERNPTNTVVVQVAMRLEHLAETDEDFDTETFGNQFLRQFPTTPKKEVPQPSSSGKRKRGENTKSPATPSKAPKRGKGTTTRGGSRRTTRSQGTV